MEAESQKNLSTNIIFKICLSVLATILLIASMIIMFKIIDLCGIVQS